MPYLEIAPYPKPRMTQKDKWAQRPVVVRYFEWRDSVRILARQAGILTLPEAYRVRFAIPMPQSWSNKKKEEMAGQPHKQRPDLDNYIKALNDALAEGDDSKVWDIHMTKVWDCVDCAGQIHIEPIGK